MRAFLIGSSPQSDCSPFLDSLGLGPHDLRIGIDGGVLRWKEMGYVPHFAIGDWDSLENHKKALKGVPSVTLPQEKDRSDLHYAGLAALEFRATELICLGVTGGRPDHHLASLLDLSEFSAGTKGYVKRVEAHDPMASYFFLSQAIPKWRGTLAKGTTVSLFTLDGSASGVTALGFKYGLKNASLSASSHGLSNQVLKKNSEIQLKKGKLLVVVPSGLNQLC